MNLLQVSDLKKSYAKGFWGRRVSVLNGLSFSVPSGSITGYLGANGAGKTTTMRCVLGLDYADSGQIEIFGQPMSIEVRKRIGFLPERPYFYDHLSGVEFLQFYAQLTRKWKRSVLKDRITTLLQQVNLEFAKDRLLRTYSKGMLQKIGLAQALIHEPELVILDEPMSGLDPDGRMALADVILQTAKQGTAVFFTSHLLHDTERLCDRLVMMKAGRTIYEGTTDNLLEASGLEFEVVYSAQGQPAQLKVDTVEQLQPALRKLMQDGAQIIEVRRLRATLEEVFVKMALRGGKP
jgi:ABC-2 type transport system ATP-binding protein